MNRSRSPEGKAIKGPISAAPRGQGDSPKPKTLQVENSLIAVDAAYLHISWIWFKG